MQQFALGIEFHEDLVLGRAAESAVFLAPLHRRRAAHPQLIVLGHEKAPRGYEIAPFFQIFAVGAENLNTHVVAIGEDRKSTRLNSSHTVISYAVFCLKKKKKK